MKLKYFLKGFGSGVLFATVILSIALLLHPAGKERLTDGEIMARARELGMELATNAGAEESSGAKEENETSMTETQKPSEPETTREKPEKDTQNEPVLEIESVAETDVSVSKDDTRIVIEIAKGLSAESISQILQDAEVVESSVEFNYYVMSHGMSRVIRAGTYEFSRGMSFEDIAEEICIIKEPSGETEEVNE